MASKKPKSKVSEEAPLVGVVMGSKSDWETMGHAVALLEEFGVPCEYRVVSAHRMPDAMATYAKEAEARGLHAIIAGAGGAAGGAGCWAWATVARAVIANRLARAIRIKGSPDVSAGHKTEASGRKQGLPASKLQL